MNVTLIIAGAVLILVAGLVLKGRSKKNPADRQARYRAPRPPASDRAPRYPQPDRAGRPAERPGLPPKKAPFKAAPVLLSLVLLVLGLWLTAAYLLPGAESATPAPAVHIPPPPPPQAGAATGRLNAPEPPAGLKSTEPPTTLRMS